ncbi:unnamed protein product, partial [Ectocarpus sp. 12 AP-2014]
VAQVLNQLTIEYGPKSAQLLDGALMPFIRRTYQLTPGAVGAEAQQLLAHEVAERAGFQKLCFSVIQHVSSNGLAGVLSSPTNAPHLDGVLRSVVNGLSGAEDASTKKTCLYIFSLLL